MDIRVLGLLCQTYLRRCLPDDWMVRLGYRRYYGRWPNLSRPKLFSEKIAWRKLHERTELMVRLSDKVQAKEEIRARVGDAYVTPNLWVGDRPEEIPFDRLARPYIVKLASSSGGHLVIREGDPLPDRRRLREMALRLRIGHGWQMREWAYRRIPPRILVEPLHETQGDGAPTDYRFFVFRGKARLVHANCESDEDGRGTIYERDWQLSRYGFVSQPVRPKIARPEKLEEMLAIAERIAEGFEFMRVDLYLVNGRILFSEATLYPWGGLKRLAPPEWDQELGAMWDSEEK